MTNNTVIRTIKNICIENEDVSLHNYVTEDLYVVITHGYYFVRPGLDTERFVEELMFEIAKGVSEGLQAYSDDRFKWFKYEYTRYAVTKNIWDVVLKFFDREFFEEQILKLANEDLCCEKLLPKYLKKFDEEQILNFIDIVEYLSGRLRLLQTFGTESIWLELSNRCCELSGSTSLLLENPERWFERFDENPKMLFEYLDKKEIIQIIKKLITKDKVLAGHLARVFNYTDDFRTTCLYAVLIDTLEDMCGVSLYAW